MFRIAESSLVPLQAVPEQDIHGESCLVLTNSNCQWLFLFIHSYKFLQVDPSSLHPSNLVHAEAAQDEEDHSRQPPLCWTIDNLTIPRIPPKDPPDYSKSFGCEGLNCGGQKSQLRESWSTCLG